MIYEMRTYTLKPGTVPEFEAWFAQWIPHREKYSRLGALWHTEIGPLNQKISVWPYEDLNERERVRAESARDPGGGAPRAGQFGAGDVVLTMESEILTPAPFMRPLGNQQLGNIYEMRTDTYQPGSIPEVIRRWSEAIPHREKYSPLAACWYTELGGLNKLIHVWPYKDMAEWERAGTAAAKDPNWPPQTTEFLVRAESKILVPAACSPMR